jgi:hypothetical protein
MLVHIENGTNHNRRSALLEQTDIFDVSLPTTRLRTTHIVSNATRSRPACACARPTARAARRQVMVRYRFLPAAASTSATAASRQTHSGRAVRRTDRLRGRRFAARATATAWSARSAPVAACSSGDLDSDTIAIPGRAAAWLALRDAWALAVEVATLAANTSW